MPGKSLSYLAEASNVCIVKTSYQKVMFWIFVHLFFLVMTKKYKKVWRKVIPNFTIDDLFLIEPKQLKENIIVSSQVYLKEPQRSIVFYFSSMIAVPFLCCFAEFVKLRNLFLTCKSCANTPWIPTFLHQQTAAESF